MIVFSTPTCPWCHSAKSYLRSRGVPFRDVDVSRDPAAARDLVRCTGQIGLPVIEIDGRPIVGFDQARVAAALGLQEPLEIVPMSEQIQPLGSRVLVKGIESNDLLAILRGAPVAVAAG